MPWEPAAGAARAGRPGRRSQPRGNRRAGYMILPYNCRTRARARVRAGRGPAAHLPTKPETRAHRSTLREPSEERSPLRLK